MNPDLPPVSFTEPQIRPRRRERRGFEEPPPIPAERRREIATELHRHFHVVNTKLRALSPEARRAVFLKLTHDRAITKSDLAGTGMVILAQSGTNETLIAPRAAGDISKLEQRIEAFAAGDVPARPAGTELATNVTNIDVADPKSRLSDSLARDYEQLVQSEFVKYEIEVMSFKAQERPARRETESIIEEIRRSLANGVHGHIYEHEVRGHGARVLLGTTGQKLRDFVESAAWQRKIVFFDERPKFETFHQVFDEFNVANLQISPPPPDAEIICVIDTGVAAGNPFLRHVLRTDISHSFISGFSALEDECGHGSGVASLAAYYPFDISAGATNEGGSFIASARITTNEGQLDYPPTGDLQADRRREARLLSKILRDVVVHFTPLGVRVFVLAFQILGHIWSKATRRLIPRNEWLARTIDQLSREFDVVFVGITGNLNAEDIEDLMAANPHPRYLAQPFAKLHDPGQAALAVTVGSIAHTGTVVAAPQVAIALAGQPSPFTRSGPGFGDSIKPDFVEAGGNLVHDTQFNRVRANLGTNVVMASGRLTPALQHNNGTSFAAPRVAHHLARIARDLRLGGINASAPLLRAFLAASAEQVATSDALSAEESRALSGFGLPNGFSATDCQNHSILLYWQGAIRVAHNAIFRIHVPPELSSVGRGRKRIIVAIASAPPVQNWGLEEYLGAEMKFWLYRGDRPYAEIEAALQREADQPNTIPTTTTDHMVGDMGINARSVGCLQRASFEWSDHDPNYSADDYTLAVTLSQASWVSDETDVPIAVVVRVEDSTARFQELYARVRARTQARARATA